MVPNGRMVFPRGGDLGPTCLDRYDFWARTKLSDLFAGKRICEAPQVRRIRDLILEAFLFCLKSLAAATIVKFQTGGGGVTKGQSPTNGAFKVNFGVRLPFQRSPAPRAATTNGKGCNKDIPSS